MKSRYHCSVIFRSLHNCVWNSFTFLVSFLELLWVCNIFIIYLKNSSSMTFMVFWLTTFNQEDSYTWFQRRRISDQNFWLSSQNLLLVHEFCLINFNKKLWIFKEKRAWWRSSIDWQLWDLNLLFVQVLFTKSLCIEVDGRVNLNFEKQILFPILLIKNQI